MKHRNYNNNNKKNCKPDFPDPACLSSGGSSSASADGVCGGPTVIPFLPPLLIVLIVVEFVCRAQMVAMLVSSIFGPRAPKLGTFFGSSVGDTTNRTQRLLAGFYVRHWVCFASVISRGMSRRRL